MTENPVTPYAGHEPPRVDEPDLAPRTTTPDAGYLTAPVTPSYGATESGTVTGTDEGTAKGEAKRVADTAASAGAGVAQTAKDGAGDVVAETKQQASSLFATVRSEVGEQAGTQQQRIADAVHGLSKELGGMASSSSDSGPLTDLAHEAAHRGGEIAHWLQDREPADVLEAVRSYARRRPVAFLAWCGLAGVVAGRLTRSTVATRTSLDTPATDRPAAVERHQGNDLGNGYQVTDTGPDFRAPVPAAATPPPTGTLATETSTVTVPSVSDPAAPAGGTYR